ncbi:protein translocase subunit SecD [Thalassospiraceae bacterium LMO-JJ14]|nr:protein translocase subunit SecD [Thalassospiraceae bacterium LMO-JJ14]
MVNFPTWKKVLVALVCFFGIAFAAPNFAPENVTKDLPDWIPHQQVNLGLDLRGGSHLLLEVEVQAVINEYLEALVDSARAELRGERIRYRALGKQTQSIGVTIPDAAQRDKALELLKALDSAAETSIDGDRITIAMTDPQIIERRTSAVQQSIEIIRRRIDETGVREPTIQRQGDDRVIVQLPGIDDPERVKRLIGKTAKLTFQMVDVQNSVEEAMAGRVPPGSVLLPLVESSVRPGQNPFILVKKRIAVSGENLVDAQPTFDGRDSQPVVSFRFDTIGARKFGKVTTENVKRPFAIVLDGKVISAPTIQEPILGGSGQISGSFSVQETNDLSLLLRAGALPAPLTILEERTVGPGLGADSIAAGEIACLVGLVAVIIFMVIAYGRFGIYADIALAMNIFLILGALSLLQATLTLPGIAGIVLTIGMAVDANVLIFERIREEVRSGRTPISAIDAGYSRAMTTIIDANLTTLIAAVLLYSFGSGPVRGFAVTLAIGIVTSMFTAIMLTRLFVVSWLRKTRPNELPL